MTPDEPHDDTLEPWPDGMPVQEQLPLDEPVPYRLTAMGRRHVAPDELPRLRVVDAGHVDLDQGHGTDRARARALRRAGMHTLDIADELGAEPLHVEAWVADLPAASGAARSGRRRGLRIVDPVPDEQALAAATRERWRVATEDGREEAEVRLAAEPGLRTGLGIVAGLLEPDPHSLRLAGDHVPLLAAGWGWIRLVLDAPADGARVLAQHDPAEAGDRIAHEVASALGLEVTAVTTTRDVPRTGRAPWLRLRVSDPALAGRVLGWQRALLAEMARGAG